MPSPARRNIKYKLFFSAMLSLAGVVSSAVYFNVDTNNIDHKIVAYISIMAFAVFGVIWLHTFTSSLNRIIANHRLGAARAAAIQFAIRVFGYLIILLGALELMNISVAKLLLGGAVVGIILGVAAQQALGNFFASMVLIASHPFRVGEEVTLFSGALGGEYQGLVTDIGLTHTRLRQKDGRIVFMPNATLLSGAAISPDNNASL